MKASFLLIVFPALVITATSEDSDAVASTASNQPQSGSNGARKQFSGGPIIEEPGSYWDLRDRNGGRPPVSIEAHRQGHEDNYARGFLRTRPRLRYRTRSRGRWASRLRRRRRGRRDSTPPVSDRPYSRRGYYPTRPPMSYYSSFSRDRYGEATSRRTPYYFTTQSTTTSSSPESYEMDYVCGCFSGCTFYVFIFILL